MQYQPKLMKNTLPFYIVFQVLKVTSYKNLYLGYSYWIFSFFCFTLAFTSADIICHRFLELHSTLSEKKIFVINLLFLTDSLNPPPTLYGQNPLSVTKVICQCSLSHVTITFEYIITCHFLKIFLKPLHDDVPGKLQIYTHSVF